VILPAEILLVALCNTRINPVGVIFILTFKNKVFKSLSPALLRRSGYAKAKGEGFRVRHPVERG